MSILITEMSQRWFSDIAMEGAEPMFDIGIVAFGSDSRSTHVITQMRRSMKCSFAVHPADITIDSTVQSAFEKRHAAKIMDVDALCSSLIKNIEIWKSNGVEKNIFVDVSSLSRTNLASIFACFKILCLVAPIRLSIGYALARYVTPPDQPFPSIRRLAPVHREFSGWGGSPTLPVDVVVSLGYEKGKAIGAVEYLEPRNRWVFVPNSPEQRFLQQVKNHNKQLINAGDSVIDYDVLEPVDTYYKLMSLVIGISSEARPVLLPFGPKLFFAIGLLVAMRVEKAAVWHVDSDEETKSLPSSPSGHGVIFSCRISGVV